MTTLDAIKLLPMDDEVKTQILNMYEYMEPAQRLSIETMAWEYYDMMLGQKLDANLDEQMDKVLKGEENLGKEYYAKAVKKTDIEMTKSLSSSATQTDLAAARKAMEQIMGEIRATKASKKTKITQNK